MKMDENGPGHIKIQPISSNDFGWAIMHWSFHRQFRMVDKWHISDVTLLQVWTLHAIMIFIYCIVICFVSWFSCDKTHTNKQEKQHSRPGFSWRSFQTIEAVFLSLHGVLRRGWHNGDWISETIAQAFSANFVAWLVNYVVAGCCCVFWAHGVINLDPVANGIPSGKLT
jgi:hypothetical protein